MAPKANNFIIRSISGAVLAVVTIAAVMFSPVTLLALCLVITAGAMYEFYRLAPSGNSINPVLPITIALLSMLAAFASTCGMIDVKWALLIIPAVFTLFIRELYGKREQPLVNLSLLLAGMIYVALPMYLLSIMGIRYTNGELLFAPVYPLAFILIIWANDVGAYLVGITIGKHRLFERISPKKSWEGFFGGVLFAVATGYAVAYYTEGDPVFWACGGVIISLTAVAGDLVESMFKRAAGVKDSGRAIPGHGGFLDRFDAMFIAAPFFYVLIKILR